MLKYSGLLLSSLFVLSVYANEAGILTRQCYNNVCLNGGNCVFYEVSPNINKNVCICPDNFRGEFCEIKMVTKNGSVYDMCTSQSRCMNDGKCVLKAGQLSCLCRDNFMGEMCQNYNGGFVGPVIGTTTVAPVPVDDECKAAPCKNWGTCKSFTGGANKGRFWKCFCQYGYRGTFCEVAPLPANTDCEPNPCFNGGKCLLNANTGKFFGCQCPSVATGTFYGLNCEKYKQNVPTAPVCDANSCFNGAQCTKGGCVCPSGYSGDSCEKLNTSKLCDNVDCNGGKCRWQMIGTVPSAKCDCSPNPNPTPNQPETKGYHCELAADYYSGQCNFQCENNGRCEQRLNLSGAWKGYPSAYCFCAPGYSGYRCSTKYFQCTEQGNFADPQGCRYGRYFECKRDAQNEYVISRRECPSGLRFNKVTGFCDLAHNLKFQC